MEEIYHNKFSLFKLEETVWNDSLVWMSETIQPCFKYVETFDSLKDAKIAKEKIKEKSIILSSY